MNDFSRIAITIAIGVVFTIYMLIEKKHEQIEKLDPTYYSDNYFG